MKPLTGLADKNWSMEASMVAWCVKPKNPALINTGGLIKRSLLTEKHYQWITVSIQRNRNSNSPKISRSNNSIVQNLRNPFENIKRACSFGALIPYWIMGYVLHVPQTNMAAVTWAIGFFLSEKGNFLGQIDCKDSKEQSAEYRWRGS